MNYLKVRRVVFAALLAALACAATFIKIPVPSMTNGYVNLGDCFVLLAGFLLGPLYGGLAGGVGSALTDVLSGYALYAPATLVIKFIMAAVTALIARNLKQRFHIVLSYSIAAIVGELIMIGGYFAYELVLYGTSAIGSIPGNTVQAVAGAVSSIIIILILEKNSDIKKLLGNLQKDRKFHV